jgi:hypothetical protein
MQVRRDPGADPALMPTLNPCGALTDRITVSARRVNSLNSTSSSAASRSV